MNWKYPPIDIVPNEVTYLMRCGDFIKIGRSVEPERRRLMFQVGNPLKITIIATLPFGELYERHLHNRFAAQHHRDEWFRFEGALAAWVRNGCLHKRDIATVIRRHHQHRKEFKARQEVAAARIAEAARLKKVEDHKKWMRPRPLPLEWMVGAVGIEPTTSCVSSRRSPAELSTLPGTGMPVAFPEPSEDA